MYKKLAVALLIGAGLQAATQRQYVVGDINSITTRTDYDAIVKEAKRQPTIIMFGSDSCSACPMMEKALKPFASQNPTVRFYKVNASQEAFKGIQSELGIKGYPTTYFYCPNGAKKVERGSMGGVEIKEIIEKNILKK